MNDLPIYKIPVPGLITQKIIKDKEPEYVRRICKRIQ